MKKYYWVSAIGVIGLLVAFGLGATIRLPLNTEAKEDRPTQTKQKPVLDTSLRTVPIGCWQPTPEEQVCATAIWRFTGYKEHPTGLLASGTYKIDWDNRSTRQWKVTFELKFYDEYGFELSSLGHKNYSDNDDFRLIVNPKSQQTKTKVFYLRLSNLEEASSISKMAIFARVYSPKWDQ